METFRRKNIKLLHIARNDKGLYWLYQTAPSEYMIGTAMWTPTGFGIEGHHDYKFDDYQLAFLKFLDVVDQELLY